jgi:YD repeat-containing protein
VNITRNQALDVLSRPSSVTVPNTTAMKSTGGPATVNVNHTYDTLANHKSTTDTGVVPTSYNYDGLNRRSAELSNDAGNTSAVLNTAGDVTSYTSAVGTVLTPTYDSLGRLKTVANAGTTYHQYGYVTGRADGLLASMTDAETSTWTYTTAGAMLTQQQNISGVQRNLSFTRDSVGRPLTLTYPSGMVVSTGYTKDVVASMTVKPAGASAASTLLSGVSYLPFTQAATAWTWGNAQAFSRSFDGNGRITAVKLGTHQRSYAYDAAGRVQTQTDVVAGVTNSITNGYDEAGHLISYVPAGGVAQTFTYDVNGNRKTDRQRQRHHPHLHHQHQPPGGRGQHHVCVHGVHPRRP